MAVPNPERELQRLQKLLRGGLPSCLVVMGKSDFFRQEAFDLALAAVVEDIDVRSISGERETDGREIDDLRGGTLFSRGTVVAVRRGEAWLKQHGEALLASLPAIAERSALIIEVVKLDRRTKLAKQLLAAGELCEFRDLYSEPYDRSRSPLEAELVGWLVGRSKGMSCPLSAEAAFLVVSSVGTKPAELLDEVERIGSRVGEVRRPLTADEVRGSLTCSFESNPFEFVEAVLNHDRKGATRALVAMYSRGTQGRDGARIDQGGLFPFITSWLYQCLAQLHEGRLLLDGGIPARDVPSRLGVRTFTDRFLSQLRANTESQLRRGLLFLLQCQRELRSSGEDPESLLLRFLGRYLPEEAA